MNPRAWNLKRVKFRGHFKYRASFVKEYFKLQFRRQIRSIKDLKMDPVIGMAVGAMVFIWISWLIFKKVYYPAWLYCFLSLVLTSTLGERSRNEFLKNTFFRKPYYLLRILENVLCATPFCIYLLCMGHWIAAILLIVLSAGLALLNPVAYPSLVIPSPFSKRPFEFTTGFRNTYMLVIILIAISVISIFYHNVNLGMVCLMGLFLLCITYYTGREPMFYVWIHAQSSRQFLKEKIKTGILYGFLLSLCISIPLLVFNPDHAGFIALITGIGLLDIALMSVAVYASFPAPLNLIQNIKIVSAILFPPLLLYVIPDLYFQSVKRLNELLK